MLEKQRTHLENLIDSRVSFAVQAEQKIGTKWEGQSKMVAEQVEGTLKEYLDFIQSYTGTHQKDLGHWVNELGHWVLVDTSTEEEK